MSDLGVAGDEFLGGFMGNLSYLLTWIFIFGAAIVAMVALYIYLPLRKRESYRYYAGELSCLAGLGLFLLLQLVLAGCLQPMPTLAFLLLLIPIGVKLLFSSVKDAVTGGEDSSGGRGGAVTIVSTSSTREEDDEEDGVAEDVLLVRLGKNRVRGFSAVSVNPTSSASTFGEPHGCVTLLTALSKFQSSSTGVEWVFKVDVDPSSGDASYSFIVAASGKMKRTSKEASVEQNGTVDLVRRAIVYLRSALLSAGFISGTEALVPGVELLKLLSISKEDDGGSGVAVAIRGLPEKVLTIEDLESSSGQKQRSMSDSSLSSSASIFHPVGRLVRSMVSGNTAGSYVVRFRKTRPPEGIAILDNGMIEATNNGGAYTVRRAAGSSLLRLRNSVGGRLRLADREELAEEVMAGVRRGYWSVESYVALPKHDDDAAVKVSSTIVSCFSGGTRSVETSTLPIELPPCESNLVDGCQPFISDARFRYFTGDMSSDSLSSFITLSPPYPAVNSESSLSAEFEPPPKNGGNGNGLLHLGRAYFMGTPVGDVKIPVEDLAMHVIFLGESGFGKTTLVVILLRQLWDLDPTISWVIVDLKGEYYSQLQGYIDERIVVLEAGGGPKGTHHGSGGTGIPFRIDLLDEAHHGDERDEGAENERTARLFSALKESLAGLFRENSELSPMMERILFESLKTVTMRAGKPDRPVDEKTGGGGFFDALFDEVGKYVTAHERRDVVMSGEALKNRLERFRRGVIGDILNYNSNKNRPRKVDGNSAETDFREMLRTSKIIVDLSGCVRRGCSKEDIRLLLNLITSIVFEEAFKRKLIGAPRVCHLSVIEEANVLVPDVLRRKTMGDLTATEDMILTARGFGEGLILVAQRPTISSFVLANAGTKVVFRSPYDAKRVAEFMGLNEEQQSAVRSLRKFEAIVTTVQGGPYRISTAKPQQISAAPPQIGHRHHRPTQAPVSTSSLSLPRAASIPTVIEASEDEDTGVEDEDGDRNNASDGGTGSVSARQVDVKRILRRSSSAKLRLFKKVASSPKSGISVSDVVRGVFGGDRWEYLDAIRSLNDAAVWKRPLVAVLEENATLRLTEYGGQVWRAIQLDPLKRRREM